MKPLYRLSLVSVLSLSVGAVACSSSDEAGAPQDQTAPDASPDAAEEPVVTTVQFQDSNFEACVRKGLGMPEGDVFPDDMARLTALECQDAHIASIAGIEYATSLTDLSLWENQVSDLSPLSGLTELTYLQLGLNQIQDIGPLAGLTKLRRLGLSINKIASLEPLSGLTSLEWLNLDNNALTDGELAKLAPLTQLRWLTLEHNGLGDFSAVQPLLDNGCELYGNQKVSARAAGLDRLVAPSAPEAPTGKLELSVAPGGKVLLHYRSAGRRLQVRSIFSGTLATRSGRVVLRRGAAETEIGLASAGGDGLCTGPYANVCSLVIGRKGPDSASALAGAGHDAVVTVKIELREPSRTLDASWGSSDQDLLPYALPSPNQYDAGSCLFMANTGAMEILLNQHVAPEAMTNNGDTDLSERFLMIAPEKTPASQIPYDLTDTLYAYNYLGGALLNRDYPFCVGYVKDTASGSVVLSNASDPDAYESCMVNWFDQLPSDWKQLLVPTPPAERTTIFVDPLRDDNSQWRVGLYDDDTIERIKYELRTKNAPVLVVYNHYLYWHTNVIVGYDDDFSTGGGCPMVEDSIAYYEEQGFPDYATKIKERMAELGGCHDTGVFYVRDSIYSGGMQDPWYDYSTDDVQMKDRYSKRIIKLEYDWAKYLGNHTYTVHRK